MLSTALPGCGREVVGWQERAGRRRHEGRGGHQAEQAATVDDQHNAAQLTIHSRTWLALKSTTTAFIFLFALDQSAP